MLKRSAWQIAFQPLSLETQFSHVFKNANCRKNEPRFRHSVPSAVCVDDVGFDLTEAGVEHGEGTGQEAPDGRIVLDHVAETRGVQGRDRY